MCGIAGLLWKSPVDDAGHLLTELERGLAHRGPDDRGFLQYSESAGIIAGREAGPVHGCRAALAHRRLAIFDLSTAAAQPMSTADGRYHLVFNGAIYNYVELRSELESLGHRFRSSGDTEVLLTALVAWGPAALKRLTGMFALALLDTHERRLLLARDPLGIKPLYYTDVGDSLAFASEIGPLLAIPGVDRHINPQRLYDYLRFGLTDCGRETMLRGIRQVEPATFIEVPWDDPADRQIEVYWQPDLAHRSELSFEEAAGQLRDLFLKSIELHLRSDVSLGAALSGGIDSSAIVGAMRAVAGPSLDLHTFSYIADSNGDDGEINEERYARLSAESAQAVRHTIEAGPQDLAAQLDALIDSQGEPFGSTSIFAQRCVFQRAHEQGVKVMLDGQGADELFGGYRYFIACRAASLMRRGRWLAAARLLRHARRLPQSGGAPAAVLHALGLLLPPRLHGVALRTIGHKSVPPWLAGDWFAARGVAPLPPRQALGPRYLTEQLWHSLRETSLPALLRYEDRNSMAFGIESRVPFLTTGLVEFVLSLPEDYLVGPDATSKRLFRQAMTGLVPQQILQRRDKIGFATPERAWLIALRPWIEEVLQSQSARQIAAVRPQAMLAEWQAMFAGQKRFDFRFWRWVNLIRWVERRGVVVE